MGADLCLENDDNGSAIYLNEDGSFVIGGALFDDNLDADVYILKMDTNGNEVWRTVFRTAILDLCFSLIQAKDKGYLLFNSLGYDTNTRDFNLIKTDEEGKVN